MQTGNKIPDRRAEKKYMLRWCSCLSPVGLPELILPVGHQIIGVDRTDSRGEVPPGGCAIRRHVRAIGGRKRAVSARRDEAVAGARTVDIQVALGHVIERTGGRDAVAIGRVADDRTAAAILARCQLVIRVIRITLTAMFLVDQGLDSRHDGRRERRSSRTGPRAGSTSARSPAVPYIRPTDHVVVAPDAVGSKK